MAAKTKSRIKTKSRVTPRKRGERTEKHKRAIAYFDVETPLRIVKDIQTQRKAEAQAHMDYMDEKYGAMLQNAAKPPLQNAAQRDTGQFSLGAKVLKKVVGDDAHDNKNLYGSSVSSRSFSYKD